jgi:hypothetical protein
MAGEYLCTHTGTTKSKLLCNLEICCQFAIASHSFHITTYREKTIHGNNLRYLQNKMLMYYNCKFWYSPLEPSPSSSHIWSNAPFLPWALLFLGHQKGVCHQQLLEHQKAKIKISQLNPHPHRQLVPATG